MMRQRQDSLGRGLFHETRERGELVSGAFRRLARSDSPDRPQDNPAPSSTSGAVRPGSWMTFSRMVTRL